MAKNNKIIVTFIVTFIVTKDEGLALADKFKAEHYIIKKAMHEFDSVESSYLAKEALNKRNSFIHKVISEN